MAKFPRIYTKQDIINILKPFQPDTKSLHRKAIEDGFNEIKKKIEAEKIIEQDIENYDKFKPVKPKFTEKHWIDNFIIESLGGKRDGLTVTWRISNKIYIWDPFTGELDERIQEV